MHAPMYLGIALGVFLGSIPIPLPGMPAPMKLGLAGGPLIVAIILGRLGSSDPSFGICRAALTCPCVSWGFPFSWLASG